MEIVVKVRPYEGTYPFDFVEEMTRGEWRIIKHLTGYMPVTFQEGLAGGDPDVPGVLAVIALLRAGRITEDQIVEVWERFDAASAADSVGLEGGPPEQEDGDAVPPATSPEENTSSSGHATTNSSETSDETPPATGHPNSDHSEYDLRTLVS